MKSLFEKLRSKQSRDNTTTSLDWLDDLDGMDDLSALEKTTLFLSSFSNDLSIADTKRLELLLAIDERNYQRIEKTFAQYIKFDNLRPELDQRMADAIYYFYRQLYLNYHKQIEVMLSLTDKLRLHYQDFTLAVGHAMHAACAMIKVRYFSRMPTSNAAWLQVFQLFKIAEDEKFLDAPLEIYEDLNPASVSSTFVHICMLDSINKCNMNRHQIDLAANIIKTLVPDIKTSKTYNEKRHLYFVDLIVDKGAQRVRQSHLTPSCRFWETDELSIKMELLIHCIKAKKSLEPFALGNIANSPHLLEMLMQLQIEWSKTEYRRQRRKEDRKSTNRIVTVSYGIDLVTNQIKQLYNKRIPSGKSFEERLSTHSVNTHGYNVLMPYATGERWIVIDESSTGIGAEVSKEHCLTIKPDKLASVIYTAPSDTEIIGVIRSVIELAQNRRHIGIEIISRHAVLVQIVKQDTKGSRTSDASILIAENILGVTGLYLPKEDGLSESASIIMPRINFLENTTYQISSMDKKAIVHLGVALEQKDDWVRVGIDAPTLTQPSSSLTQPSNHHPAP